MLIHRHALRRDRRIPTTGFPKLSVSGCPRSGDGRTFVCWSVGFYLAFMPLYVMGIGRRGPRRSQELVRLRRSAALDDRGRNRRPPSADGPRLHLHPALCQHQGASSQRGSLSAILGMPADLNGQCRRRRRSIISLCCRMSAGAMHSTGGRNMMASLQAGRSLPRHRGSEEQYVRCSRRPGNVRVLPSALVWHIWWLSRSWGFAVALGTAIVAQLPARRAQDHHCGGSRSA